MTTDQILALFDNSILHDGASAAAIADVSRLVSRELPESYVGLMSRTNGVEGFLSQFKYLLLWPVDELAELNKGYGVHECAPGLFFFGSNGGGSGYAFDTRGDGMPVVEVPFIEMSHEASIRVGTSFEAFLQNLHHS